jgi:hypothetical protein
MARLTAQEFAEKHNRRLKGALSDMQAGVERITVSPTSQAAAKQDKMIQRLTARVQDGTWATRLRAVSLDSWKGDMIEKGIPRVSGGIDRAQGKVQDFAAQLLPYIDSQKAAIEKMPDLTLEDSIGRMSSFIRGMAKFRKK